jgi:hypothetical protein
VGINVSELGERATTRVGIITKRVGINGSESAHGCEHVSGN